MAGKLRIHVDQDKCQGHARCKSLAPELFELDEYGNAHEVGDGTVVKVPLKLAVAASNEWPSPETGKELAVVWSPQVTCTSQGLSAPGSVKEPRAKVVTAPS